MTAAQLAQFFGVDRRTITNWLNETPPCPSELTSAGRVFQSAAVVAWYAQREVRRRPATPGSDGVINLTAERARKLQLESALLELDLDMKRGALLDAEVVRAQTERLVGRLAAAVKGGLGRFRRDVQFAESAADAQEVIERMEDKLLEVLHAAADALEDEALAEDLEAPDASEVVGNLGGNGGTQGTPHDMLGDDAPTSDASARRRVSS